MNKKFFKRGLAIVSAAAIITGSMFSSLPALSSMIYSITIV